LEDLHQLAQAFVQQHPQPQTGRGRPPRYDEAPVLALWLFRPLYRSSDRRLRALAGALGHPVPEISTRHDQIARLPAQRFADFHRWSAVRRLRKATWNSQDLGLPHPLTQA